MNCSNCGGKGTVPCPTPTGTIQLTCGECHGTGVKDD